MLQVVTSLQAPSVSLSAILPKMTTGGKSQVFSSQVQQFGGRDQVTLTDLATGQGAAQVGLGRPFRAYRYL